ncbi:MAG: type IV secretion system DNA-binding domain-containing protein [Patescibacteria group bacterium]|nr:type IV secretion system DNA-binding domain-containing protein [Patescibacteria group bacterium]
MNDEIPHNRDITYFGRTNFRSTDDIFGIKRKDRRQHMYILGKSGTGKSVLLSNLIVQDINNGEGVCVVDPHGELVEEILNLIPPHRVKDVIYFNPADTDYHIGFNVIALDDTKYKHLVASGLMGIFTKIWANAWSSRMEYILNNAILALLDTPGTTLLGIPRLLVDKDYRQMIIGNLKDPVVKAFWVHEYEQWREQFRNEAIAPIQNKVGQFLSTSIIRNVVGQSKSTIDIFKIMNEGKIFLVNVSKGRVGEDNSALLGGMIITKIQLAAMERVRIPENERKDFYLYVDEFQNFATDSFANILSEARKYRLNLIIAHQYTAQLSNENGTAVRDAVFGNVGTMTIFRVGADDAEFIEKEFEPEFTAQDLVNLPNYHVYLKLMIDGVTSRPFSATTLPPIAVDQSLGVKEKIIESSRKLYTRPREEVEDEIAKWSGMLQVGEGDTKYKADCSNCGKVTMVPFEPKEGRPVYCKDCMFKIKSGELKPQHGFVASRSARQEEKVSTEPLAALGIEFASNNTNNPVDFGQQKSSQRSITDSNNKNNNKPHFSNNNINHASNHNNHANHNTHHNGHTTGEHRHSAPSPLLKGLLQKIEAENKEINNKTTIHKSEPIEVKVTPPSISLSALKKVNNNDHKNHQIPLKEASEEKKATLKDVLMKATMSDTKDILDDKVNKDIPKPEDTPIATVQTPENQKTDDSKTSTWQKRKVGKEVPEEVLRKVLE